MMIGHLTRLAARTVMLASALYVSSPLLAQDQTTRVLSANLRGVEAVVGIGDDLNTVVSEDLGFSPDHVEQWSRALQGAFAPDLVGADLLSALDATLSEPARAAALAHAASALGQEVFRLVVNRADTDDRAALEAAQAHLNEISTELRAEYEVMFEAECGPQRDSAVMDVYFRAMNIAATPIVGAEVAKQWVVSAEYLRADYAAEHFLASVAVYSQLSADQREGLIAALTSSDMVDYAVQSTVAFAETLHAATDRLEAAFAKEIAR